MDCSSLKCTGDGLNIKCLGRYLFLFFFVVREQLIFILMGLVTGMWPLVRKLKANGVARNTGTAHNGKHVDTFLIAAMNIFLGIA